MELFLEDLNYIFPDLDNLTLKEIQAKYWITISILTIIFLLRFSGEEGSKKLFCNTKQNTRTAELTEETIHCRMSEDLLLATLSVVSKGIALLTRLVCF